MFTFTLTVEPKFYYIDNPSNVEGGTVVVQTTNANPHLSEASETWQVFNITGTLIYTGTAPDVGTNLCVCPLPARGMYIVRTASEVLKVAN